MTPPSGHLFYIDREKTLKIFLSKRYMVIPYVASSSAPLPRLFKL